jgi:L-asparaginase II
MLACCSLHGWRKTGYLDADHPLQVGIRAAVAAFIGMDESALVRGIDGCSAPNYAMPLVALARAYARLAMRDAHNVFGDGPRMLCDAMIEYPAMVSGAGRSDETLMIAGRGDWVTKIGAEGVQAVGIRSRGIGIAIKIADGGKRGLHPTTASVLDQLGLCDAEQRQALESLRAPAIVNYRGMKVGSLRPIVALRDA